MSRGGANSANPHREPFRVEGGMCWCHPDTRISQLRSMGHTPECTEAREAWRRNNEKLAAADKEQRLREEIGRQIIEEWRDGHAERGR